MIRSQIAVRLCLAWRRGDGMTRKQRLLIVLAILSCILSIAGPAQAEDPDLQPLACPNCLACELEPAPSVLHAPAPPILGLNAAGQAWQEVGPEGGYVRDLCAAGDRLFAVVGLNDSEVFAYDGQAWHRTGMRSAYLACGSDGAAYVST